MERSILTQFKEKNKILTSFDPGKMIIRAYVSALLWNVLRGIDSPITERLIACSDCDGCATFNPAVVKTRGGTYTTWIIIQFGDEEKDDLLTIVEEPTWEPSKNGDVGEGLEVVVWRAGFWNSFLVSKDELTLVLDTGGSAGGSSPHTDSELKTPWMLKKYEQELENKYSTGSDAGTKVHIYNIH